MHKPRRISSILAAAIGVTSFEALNEAASGGPADALDNAAREHQKEKRMSGPTLKDRMHRKCREAGLEYQHEQTAKELQGMLTAHALADGMGKRIQAMFNKTWAYVSSDWITLSDGKDVSGAEVQEAVADADRFDIAGDKEAAAVWRALPRDRQDLILEWVFPRREKFGC